MRKTQRRKPKDKQRNAPCTTKVKIFDCSIPTPDKACLVSTNYYRLRQIDNDGTETLSKVISIATKGNNKLKAYPNPVSNTLTVENTDLSRDYREGGFSNPQSFRTTSFEWQNSPFGGWGA